MAVTKLALNADCSNLTNFKSWALAISQTIQGYGWIQTTDTGQVNWSSLAAAPTAGNYVFEVWRMSDALQTTAPVVMRIEYWNFGGTGGLGGIKILVGYASNGTGSILGNMNWYVPNNANTATVTVGWAEDCYINGGTNWLGMLLWRSSGLAQSPCYFAVERSKDVNGNDTSDYVSVVGIGYSGSMQQVLFRSSLSLGAPITSEPNFSFVTLLSGNRSSGFGNNIGISPIYPWIGRADYPMISTAVAHDYDVGEAQTVPMTLYGTQHQYILSGAQYLNRAIYLQNNSTATGRIGLRVD